MMSPRKLPPVLNRKFEEFSGTWPKIFLIKFETFQQEFLKNLQSLMQKILEVQPKKLSKSIAIFVNTFEPTKTESAKMSRFKQTIHQLNCIQQWVSEWKLMQVWTLKYFYIKFKKLSDFAQIDKIDKTFIIY